ncbi:MAG: hypothetical protein E6G41_02595 [Actinobacteria bacterium]|nr:MAG: hypothetical protein E6G41_02595 [Actinomycetota bacterium]
MVAQVVAEYDGAALVLAGAPERDVVCARRQPDRQRERAQRRADARLPGDERRDADDGHGHELDQVVRPVAAAAHHADESGYEPCREHPGGDAPPAQRDDAGDRDERGQGHAGAERRLPDRREPGRDVAAGERVDRV